LADPDTKLARGDAATCGGCNAYTPDNFVPIIFVTKNFDLASPDKKASVLGHEGVHLIGYRGEQVPEGYECLSFGGVCF
jgi:hypothetical protein